MKTTTSELARVLTALLPPDTIADILNGTVTAQDNEFLSDRQAALADELFNSLCSACPDAISIAQNS